MPKFVSTELPKTSEKIFTVDGARDRNSNSPAPEYKIMASLTNSVENRPS